MNDNLTSREKSAEVLNIDRTRLSRIELGTVVPYPEEVLSMSKAYDIPELCNSYCSGDCPIGKETVKPIMRTALTGSYFSSSDPPRRWKIYLSSL